jgi:alkylhydroperoxidase family enzyme
MLFYRADRDGNGKLTHEELEKLFQSLDRDDAGFLSLAELQEAFEQPQRRPRGSSGSSSGPSRWTLLKGLFRQEIGSLQPGPNLDERAPDFTLKTVDGKEEVTLTKLIGPKPVVLIFGNFTCGPFRSQAGNVEKLYRRYKDRASFVMVYVREAHPSDGWHMESNDRVGVSLRQPQSYDERVEVAQTCSRTLGLGFPMLVDTIDDQVGARYSGMPSRLYLIDSNGKVAFKNGRGPFGFKVAELEQSLVLLLQADDAARRSQARVTLPSDQEAWDLLPAAEQGSGQPLPSWAKAFARSLPRTTAAMLRLDRLHRTQSPLGPVLRAKMRWVAANANRCAYSMATAEADLRKAGLSDADIKALAGNLAELPRPERAALEFARQMTVSADAVTDNEVAYLKSEYGEAKLVAMVLLLAYANFQDRLLLALDLPIEPCGPLAPVQVTFRAGSAAPPVPERVRPEGSTPPPVPERVDDADWRAVDFDELQNNLSLQRGNPGRIRVPSWEEVVEVLPKGYPVPKQPVRIQWSRVCMGYQPELAAAWSACTRAFGEEAKQDRVFEESLFWVVTRTIHCFY